MSIFPKFFFTLFGNAPLPSWLRSFIARVEGDGGTVVDRNHTKEVYADVIDYEPSLIQSCDSGKAGTLYSIIPSRDLLLYQYTGAAAAYSLRSLSAGTVYVVKVRRSGDNAELDFTASQVSDGALAAWVRAGGGTEDGFVTTWYDQSGNTNNATQATAATQPQIVSSGTLLTENGKPACNFRTTRYLGFDISLSGDAFIAGVGSIDITGEAGLIRDGADALYIGWNTSQYRIELNNVRTESATQSIPGQILVAVDVLTSGGQYYVNGISKISFGYTAYTLAQSRIGSALDGSFNVIQEVIIYASDQSANRTGIEANINAHYNIYP